MKTKEELNALKEEVETLNKKLAELTEEELAQVAGGVIRNNGDSLTLWEEGNPLGLNDPDAALDAAKRYAERMGIKIF